MISRITAPVNDTRKASDAHSPPTDQGQRKKQDDSGQMIQAESDDDPTSESQLSQSQLSHPQPQERQPIFPANTSQVRAKRARRVSQPKNDEKPVPQTAPPTSISTSALMSDRPKIKPLPPTPQANTPHPRAMARKVITCPDHVSHSLCDIVHKKGQGSSQKKQAILSLEQKNHITELFKFSQTLEVGSILLPHIFGIASNLLRI